MGERSSASEGITVDTVTPPPLSHFFEKTRGGYLDKLQFYKENSEENFLPKKVKENFLAKKVEENFLLKKAKENFR